MLSGVDDNDLDKVSSSSSFIYDDKIPSVNDELPDSLEAEGNFYHPPSLCLFPYVFTPSISYHTGTFCSMEKLW